MGVEAVGYTELWFESGLFDELVVLLLGRFSEMTRSKVVGVVGAACSSVGLDEGRLSAPVGGLYSTRCPSGRVCEIGMRPKGEVATEACALGDR